jgi:hypothetical protein
MISIMPFISCLINWPSLNLAVITCYENRTQIYIRDKYIVIGLERTIMYANNILLWIRFNIATT